MSGNTTKSGNSAKRKQPVVEIFWIVVILVVIAIFTPIVINQIKQSKPEKSLRQPLDWALLPAVQTEALSEAGSEEYSHYAQIALKRVYAKTAQAPICVILEDFEEDCDGARSAEASDKARYYIITPELDGFTDNPAQAKTLLYARIETSKFVGSASSAHYIQYRLFSLSAKTGSVFPLVNEKKEALKTSIRRDDMKQASKADQSFCEWLLETLPLSDAAVGSVSQRHTELDSSILSTENVNALAEKTWGALSAWDFSPSLVQTEVDFFGKLCLPEEYGSVSPTLIIEQYSAASPEYRNLYFNNYEYPAYADWIKDAEIKYCISPCKDLLHAQITEPRYAMVCENLGYCYMGEFQKIGTLYSYYTRNALIDLETQEIIAWTLSYSSGGIEKRYSINGTQYGTGSYYVPAKDYPIDRNGFRMYENYSGSSWDTLLDIDDNYNWGGTAVILSIRTKAPDN